MLVILLLVLVILWFLNYLGLPSIPLGLIIFTFLGVSITLYQLLIFLIILAFVGLLPSPLRQIAVFLLLLWLLTIFGLITVINLSDLVVFAVIFGIVYYLIAGK